jgi:hypothetical protein
MKKMKRFALLGDHPDGLEMARALAASGRHELAIYSGSALGNEYLRRWGLEPRRVGDLEEVLADPGIQVVIVAGKPALRPGQLRRALQSERHVLCVCPVDDSPDLAYEAAMAQGDAHVVLFPILPESLHPAFGRLAELAKSSFRLLEIERWSTEEILLEAEEEGHKPGFPGWDILRRVGGEIGELSVLTATEEIEKGQPLLLSGQFVTGGLFQATYMPCQAEAFLRITLVNRNQSAELIFDQGWPGPARLTFTDDQGGHHTETWEAFDPWAALVNEFDRAERGLTWQDAIRGLELDDAARRSVHRRRTSTLEFQEVTEEASFKGTMTLVGCSILWISLLLLILSAWFPWLGWIIAPVFGVFLAMQVLRWVVPGKVEEKKPE